MAESHSVNFSGPKSFSTKLKSKCKETLFPDDPFKQFRNEKHRSIKALQYFIPFFEWIPNYNLKLLRYDVLAGITITSLAIPQGISYAKLASIPPIIGLCKKPFGTRTRVASFFLKKKISLAKPLKHWIFFNWSYIILTIELNDNFCFVNL